MTTGARRIVRGTHLDKVARAVTEAELQSWVLELSKVLGLLVFHSGDSRRDSCAGFPDLVIVGSKGVLYRELKRMGPRPTLDQQRWLSRLALARQDAGVWRPVDWFTDRIATELKVIR